MISQPTVLVLGAGASKPYGFPLGSTLSEHIRSGLAELPHLRVPLARVGIEGDEIDKLAEQFRLSGSRSIDNWLARLPKTIADAPPRDQQKFKGAERFILVGKALIAAVILHFEARSNLHPTKDGDDNWYSYLWHQMHYDCDWDELQKNRLSVITFNYDRSLETFLRLAGENLYHKGFHDVETWMRTIPIVHVYGEVAGHYAWDLDARLRHDNLGNSAHSIQVIPEGRNNTETLQYCHQLLKDADRICYLGFGYDPQNLQHIDAANSGVMHIKRETSMFGRKIYGTALGLTTAEANRAAQLCGIAHRGGFPRTPFLLDLNCTGLLRETGVLID